MVSGSRKRAAAAPMTAAAILVIPPRELMRDELRMARLSEFLDAEFPALDLTLCEDRHLAGARPAAGLRRRPGEAHPLRDSGTADAVERVLDAVQTFLDYGRRRH